MISVDRRTIRSHDPNQRKLGCGLPTPLSRTTPSHPSTHRPRGTITKLPLTSPGGWLCVLPLGLPTTGIQTCVTVIILDCNWESSQKRLLLLGLNSRFLPACNLPYPLNSVSHLVSWFPAQTRYSQGRTHGERPLSPKPNKRIFLEGRDHGLTLLVSFPDSRPVSNIFRVLNRNLFQHLTGKQESRNWRLQSQPATQRQPQHP